MIGVIVSWYDHEDTGEPVLGDADKRAWSGYMVFPHGARISSGAEIYEVWRGGLSLLVLSGRNE